MPTDLRGEPYQKEKNRLGQGWWPGHWPSSIAIVSEQSASLERFCAELEPQQKQIRKLQRKLDRSGGVQSRSL